jgi:hypothetical protein
VVDDYLPQPCVLDPEQVREVPSIFDLPEALVDLIRAWDADGGSYTPIAPGWKLGGHVHWALTDPVEVTCDCGAAMDLLASIGHGEWHPQTGAWRPDADDPAPGDDVFHRFPEAWDPTAVVIGRGNGLWVHTCPASFDHPPRSILQ